MTIKVTPVNEPPYFDKNILNYYVTFKEVSVVSTRKSFELSLNVNKGKGVGRFGK